MMLTCNHCGEVIESGLVNVCKHVFEDCKAVTTKEINDAFSIVIRPFASFTSVETEKLTNNKTNNHE